MFNRASSGQSQGCGSALCRNPHQQCDNPRVTACNRIDDAIEAKNSQQFNKAFGELTGGCNECHQSMERPFIVMELPTDQPFGNQAVRGDRATR